MCASTQATPELVKWQRVNHGGFGYGSGQGEFMAERGGSQQRLCIQETSQPCFLVQIHPLRHLQLRLSKQPHWQPGNLLGAKKQIFLLTSPGTSGCPTPTITCSAYSTVQLCTYWCGIRLCHKLTTLQLSAYRIMNSKHFQLICFVAKWYVKQYQETHLMTMGDDWAYRTQNALLLLATVAANQPVMKLVVIKQL